jgi:hypothetical protein
MNTPSNDNPSATAKRWGAGKPLDRISREVLVAALGLAIDDTRYDAIGVLLKAAVEEITDAAMALGEYDESRTAAMLQRLGAQIEIARTLAAQGTERERKMFERRRARIGSAKGAR